MVIANLFCGLSEKFCVTMGMWGVVGWGIVRAMQAMEGVEGDPQWMGSFNNQLLQKAEVEMEEAMVEEEEEEEEVANTILQVSLRPAPFASVQKMNFPELCRKFRCFLK